MKKKNENHGGIEPSKAPISGLPAGADACLQQSLYIAALDRFLGASGLVYPVHDERGGHRYTFDFFQPGRDTLFKIMRTLDEHDLKRYANYIDDTDLDVICIFDANPLGLTGHKCKKCGGESPSVEPRLVEAVDELGGYVFHDGTFWERSSFEDEGPEHHLWAPVMPVEREIIIDFVAALGIAPVGFRGSVDRAGEVAGAGGQ